MPRILITAFLVLFLSACTFTLGGAGDRQADLRTQVIADLAPLYGDIGAFCLAHILGAPSQAARLTRAGFTGQRGAYERVWKNGTRVTALRIRARESNLLGFGARGCSADTQYRQGYEALPEEAATGLQAGWAAYLRSQGFTVAEVEQEGLRLVSSEGEEILDLGLSTKITLATRGTLKIRLGSQDNGIRAQEFMDVVED